MKDHSWVRIVITPIHVIDDPTVSEAPVVFIGEDDETEAAECAQYGCLRCDEPLTSETVRTHCEDGEDLGWAEVQQIIKPEDKP